MSQRQKLIFTFPRRFQIFISEFVSGRLYGSAPAVLHQALAFIANTSTITRVITHNDAGAYELSKLGKYAGRFYAVPAYEQGHRSFFETEKDRSFFLVVEMPILYQPSFYRSFFNTCQVVFQTSSGQIPAYVYDCRW